MNEVEADLCLKVEDCGFKVLLCLHQTRLRASELLLQRVILHLQPLIPSLGN